MLRDYEKGSYGNKPSEYLPRSGNGAASWKSIQNLPLVSAYVYINPVSDEVPASAIAPIVGHEGVLITDQVYWKSPCET
jgi:hypothetical protein